jgi:hypothetical protein
MFNVRFGVEYFSDYSKFIASVAWYFIIINILAFIVIGQRFLAFTMRNPRSVLGDDVNKAWTTNFLLYLFDYWSEFNFWLLFAVCANIFISYKVQMRATKLLPEEGEASQ